MPRSVKSIKSPKTKTPAWINDILDAIDDVGTPVTKTAPGIFQSPGASKMTHQATSVINFLIAGLGLAFSIVNAIYLANIEKECATGYNPEEKKFLYITSIIMAILFGILTISGTISLATAFR